MPTKPKFVQLDPAALEKEAIAQDTKAYGLSDQDYLDRGFGPLVEGNKFATQSAADNLTPGYQDPVYDNAFQSSGFGKVNLGPDSFAFSRNVGGPILSKEQRDRNYFAREFSAPQNQPRQFGGGGQAQVEIAASNSGNATAFNQAIADITNAGDVAKQQQSAALISGLIGGAGQAVKSAVPSILSAGNSSYIDPAFYNYKPASSYYNPGFAPSTTGGAYEGTIGSQPVYRATPVSSTSSTGGGF